MGLVSFLDFTMIQRSTAHVFLDHYMEVEDDEPHILKERAAARGGQLRNPWVHFPEEIQNCSCSQLRTNKNMGNYRAWFCLVAWWGAREVGAPVGEQGSELKRSQSPNPRLESCK